MKRLLTITLVSFLILSIFVFPLLAETKKIDAVKLERGAKNVVFGWTDIPKSVVQVTEDTNNPLLGITVGLVKGVLNTFARTTSGVMDVVSSPARPKAKGPVVKTEIVETETAASSTK